MKFLILKNILKSAIRVDVIKTNGNINIRLSIIIIIKETKDYIMYNFSMTIIM